MNRTQIYLPQNRLRELRKIAHERNTTLSQVIREFVERGLEGDKSPKKKTKKFESLLDVADNIERMGVGGPKDLSQNLDKYLYGKV